MLEWHEWERGSNDLGWCIVMPINEIQRCCIYSRCIRSSRTPVLRSRPSDEIVLWVVMNQWDACDDDAQMIQKPAGCALGCDKLRNPPQLPKNAASTQLSPHRPCFRGGICLCAGCGGRIESTARFWLPAFAATFFKRFWSVRNICWDSMRRFTTIVSLGWLSDTKWNWER